LQGVLGQQRLVQVVDLVFGEHGRRVGNKLVLQSSKLPCKPRPNCSELSCTGHLTGVN
jgi:hypothetical protein